MRVIALLLAAILLTGCALRLPAAPPPLPTPTPTPDATAAFEAAYADMLAAYNALSAEMDGKDNTTAVFADADYRARLAELAADWRTASNAVRYAEQPAGERWAKAWPRITDAMAEFAALATLVEHAARDNDPTLMWGGGPRLAAAVALLDEAIGLLGRE